MQVLLQNCHLATDWLPALAAHVQAFASAGDLHQDFRLWLTSAPTPQFPVSVLRACIKATVEQSAGLREGVVASLSELPEDLRATCESSSSAQWRALVHAVVLFHGVAQERRGYMPTGWIVPYDFAHADLVCSLRTARNLLRAGASEAEQGVTLPWAAITHILGQIHYGGRVTDENDRRLLDALIKRHVSCEALGESREHAASVQSMLEHAQGLPDHGGPELLSLHRSAARQRDLQHGQALIRDALRLQPHAVPDAAGSAVLPRHSSGSATALQRADEILSSLPAALDLGKASQVRCTTCSSNFCRAALLLRISAPQLRPRRLMKSDLQAHNPFAPLSSGDTDPLGSILRQEVELYSALLRTVVSTLESLQRAVRGLETLSQDLEQALRSILDNEVWPPAKPHRKCSLLFRRFLRVRATTTPQYSGEHWVAQI